jgi:hypothetical protein
VGVVVFSVAVTVIMRVVVTGHCRRFGCVLLLSDEPISGSRCSGNGL